MNKCNCLTCQLEDHLVKEVISFLNDKPKTNVDDVMNAEMCANKIIEMTKND